VEGFHPVIQIDSFHLAERTLRLSYRVKNVSHQDIWVCEDMYPRPTGDDPQDFETRVTQDTLWIRLRYRHKPGLFLPATDCARYRRIGSGWSCSGAILVDIPVGNASPIDKFYGQKMPVSASRMVLELGYFDGDLPALVKDYPHFQPPWKGDPNTVLVSHLWEGLAREQATQISIADVAIPCMALVKEIKGQSTE
jgi:hypothetical protein